MRTWTLIALQVALALTCSAQSYTVNHFQSTYDTLADYHSVNIELGLAGENPYYWDKTFDFGFAFPFFGETYTEVEMNSDAIGSFPQSLDYNLYMFAGSYVIAEILDTPYLFSEVRYDHVSVNDLEALVIEYHNIYVEDEYDENGANHTINFQVWFLENGIIELRFGNIDLTQCSYYFPGQGFSFDNEDPTGEIYGPWVSINNSGLSEGACFFGDHESPMILYDDDDNCGVVTSIPPEGYVVQFVPSGVSSIGRIDHDDACDYIVTQETDGLIRISGAQASFRSCTVYDVVGRKIGYTEHDEFDINLQNPQILILEIRGECGREIHRLVSNYGN